MDNKRDKLIEYITEVQSIAQSALYYVKDVYDKERFLRLRDISAEMMALKTDISVENTIKETREEAGKRYDFLFM